MNQQYPTSYAKYPSAWRDFEEKLLDDASDIVDEMTVGIELQVTIPNLSLRSTLSGNTLSVRFMGVAEKNDVTSVTTTLTAVDRQVTTTHEVDPT